MNGLPDRWWTRRFVYVDPVTGCWLWRYMLPSPDTVRRLIRDRVNSPNLGACPLAEGCVHPLHTTPDTTLVGAGSA